MKMFLCMVLVALLACLPMTAVAEGAIDGNAVDAQENAEQGEAAEEDAVDPFAGAWLCDDASIFIDVLEDGYSVYIMWDISDTEELIWEYTCSLDEETGALVGVGQKTKEICDEEGEVVSTTVEYTDGSATFTKEEYTDDSVTPAETVDVIIWDDAVDNAAQGMMFKKGEEEEELIEYGDDELDVELEEEADEEAEEEAEEEADEETDDTPYDELDEESVVEIEEVPDEELDEAFEEEDEVPEG